MKIDTPAIFKGIYYFLALYAFFFIWSNWIFIEHYLFGLSIPETRKISWWNPIKLILIGALALAILNAGAAIIRRFFKPRKR